MGVIFKFKLGTPAFFRRKAGAVCRPVPASTNQGSPPHETQAGQASLNLPKSRETVEDMPEGQARQHISQIVRKDLQDKGLSRSTADIIIAAWRPSTTKQYATYINQWLDFCRTRKIDSVQTSVIAVLEFLSSLYERVGYSAVNTARSALAATVTVRWYQS
ncbi:uncharacterized protein LOC121411995 [Lytechinus variegatus]|uniref:uncharacterized protein LOC121411995 n=1 Tax=Lytechinus variegatus TaxID=7654 RepID=UPI001BB28DC0|nr:uncharacterized protein LOC121411995 [Lytechinus variegatus]